MKLDTHVHARFSGDSTIKPPDRILRESYNSVEGVYRLDLVAHRPLRVPEAA